MLLKLDYNNVYDLKKFNIRLNFIRIIITPILIRIISF